MDVYVLEQYYVKYLKEIRGVSDSTVKHYQDALRHISKYLTGKGKLHQVVYELEDIEELDDLRTYLYADVDFMALDKRGHQMYSAGFNNYYKFASGELFADMYQRITNLDIEIPVAGKNSVRQTVWKRSAIIKNQSMEAVGFQCEVNPAHKTFIVKGKTHPYMEGHHAISLRLQGMFSKSLDVYANIVCLCPICHRFLHYGIDSEKEFILDKMYYDRRDRLAASGIALSVLEFKRLCCDQDFNL